MERSLAKATQMGGVVYLASEGVDQVAKVLSKAVCWLVEWQR